MGVSLTKGQKISLDKQGGGALTRVTMGLGWDAAKSGSGLLGKLFGAGDAGSIDLDAGCLALRSDKSLSETVWFRQLRSADGSIRHSGDNLTGEGDGDDETIEIDLDRVPANIEHLVFTVNSFRGQTFDEVANAFCRLIDRETGSEIAKYNLSEKGKHTGMVMARLYRHNGQWKLHAIGEPGQGRTLNEMVPHIVTLF